MKVTYHSRFGEVGLRITTLFVLFLLEAIANNILGRTTSNYWFYLAGAMVAFAIPFAILFLGNKPILRDIREICVFDFFAQLIGLALFLAKISDSYFFTLTNAIIILKFVRICWDCRAYAPTPEWPTFGLLGLWRHRHGHPFAYTLKQKFTVYGAILLTLPIGYGTQALAKAIHFPVIEPLFVVITLLFARPFLNRLEAEEAAHQQALQRQAELAVELADRVEEITDLQEAAQTMLTTLQDKANQQQHIAHDLCNRVIALESLAASALAISTHPEQRIMLEQLQRLGDDFNAGIERMIALAAIGTPPPKPVLQAVFLPDLIDSFWYTETRFAQSRAILLKKHIAPLTAHTDAKLLARIILNLLDNAISHASDGSKVSLRITQRGQHAVIAVRDNSGGLPFADSKQRADNFLALLVRLEREALNPQAGTSPNNHGLGLKSIYTLSRQLDITLGVRSQLGHATVFCLAIPLAHP